ncbi:MAG: tetratricopeptide repeat protein [Chlamydiota bacterium]|nr:tetratricopeptide repeat protein [Chlamydiota bacterium]
MNLQKIDRYLNTTQSYALRNNDIELVDFVQQQMSESQDTPSMDNFFLAERAFYQRKYQVALKNYLQAKEIPNFQFFCFRASAYVSNMMGQKEKALEFAQKAISIKPDDYATLKILIEIYSTINEQDKAEIFNKKIQSLLESELETDTPEAADDFHQYIPVGKEEMDELNQIFSEGISEDDSLFSLEEPHKSTTPYEEIHSNSDENFVMPAGCELFSHSANNVQEATSLTKRLYSFAHDSECRFSQGKQQQRIKIYSARYSSRGPLTSNFLLSFNGWKRHDGDYFLISDMVESKSSGYFLHWNGLGIAINPCTHFIENLHRNQLFFYDIHAVIITKKDSLLAYSHISLLEKSLDHKVNIFFHPDLPKSEKIDDLKVLPISAPPFTIMENEKDLVACRVSHENFQLEMKHENQKTSITFASVNSSMQGFNSSDLLISETTNIQQVSASITPKIILCNIPTTNSCDSALDKIQAMRKAMGDDVTILPTELDFMMNLDSFEVRSSDKSKYIKPKDVAVCSQMEGLETLKYISKNDLI